MFRSDTKLKKKTDSIFQEAEFPKDRSRPLEWRRGFNGLSLPLANIEIVTNFSTHDKDWDLRGKFQDNPAKLIKPDVKTGSAIRAIVHHTQMRDTIYCAEQDEDDEDIFTLERPEGETRVVIKGGEPIEGNEELPAGVFIGSCFRMNYGPGEDDMIFEMMIPEEQLNVLAGKIQSDPSAAIDLYVELLSFSFEVDDCLREPHHPREIFIHGFAHAFVSSMSAASKVGTHAIEKSEDEEDYYLDSDVDEHKALSFEQQSHRELVQVLLNLQKPLTGIGIALWILVLVLGSTLLF